MQDCVWLLPFGWQSHHLSIGRQSVRVKVRVRVRVNPNPNPSPPKEGIRSVPVLCYVI